MDHVEGHKCERDRNLRTLFWTITAFTVAHSVFVAVELVRQSQGHPTLASRKPWLVAFTFGLLHGLGFASALAEIGLPHNNVPLALLFFNVGVEIGQVAFVAALLGLTAVTRRFSQPAQIATARLVSCYGIGGLASYWLSSWILRNRNSRIDRRNLVEIFISVEPDETDKCLVACLCQSGL